MKKFVLLGIALFSSQAFSSLAPEFQNMRDIRDMEAYISENKKVGATVKSIDVRNTAVYYGDDCKVTFYRQKPKVDVGPKGPLLPDYPECNGRKTEHNSTQ